MVEGRAYQKKLSARKSSVIPIEATKKFCKEKMNQIRIPGNSKDMLNKCTSREAHLVPPCSWSCGTKNPRVALSKDTLRGTQPNTIDMT